MKINWFTCVKVFVSLILFTLLFKFVDVKQIWVNLKDVHIGYLLLAVFFFLVMTMFDLVRIYASINHKKQVMSFDEVYEFFKPIWTLSFFLPSRLSDLSWVVLLKKKGLKIKEITWIMVINLFFVYAVFGILALMAFSDFIFVLPSWMLVVSVIGFGITSLYMFFNFNRFLIWCTALLKVVSQMCLAIFLGMAVNPEWASVNYIGLIFVQALAMGVSFLPITFAGLGARESVQTFLFTKIGFGVGEAALMALLNTVITYLFVLVLSLMIKKEVMTLWKKKV